MPRTLMLAAAVVLATSAPATARAQVLDAKVLSLDAAMSIADAALAEAESNDWDVVIVIVDASGELLHLRRMDGVQMGSIDIAIAKASTAARLRRETKVLADAVAAGATGLLSVDGIIALEGGVPIIHEGTVIGGIGVSGVQAFQDAHIARAGAAASLAR